MDDTTKLLERIAKALELKNGGTSELGFHDPQGVRTIHVGREKAEEAPWYFWNGPQHGREDIQNTAITAYIKGMKMEVDGEYKGADNEKLFLYLDCGDRQFRLRTGWNSHDPDKTTVVGKSLVVAIAEMTSDQLKKPVTIQVRPKGSEEPKLIFVNVTSDGNWIQAEWPTKDNWRANQDIYLNRAIGKVESVWGAAQNTPQPAATDTPPAPRTQAPPVAPPRPAAPARPTPSGQTPAAGVRSRTDIIKSINEDHLRMPDEDKRIVFPKAMSAIGQPVQTKLDDLSDSDFTRFVDEFLIAWGDSVSIEISGLSHKLYEGDCSGEFWRVMAMCADQDPWKRAKFWANAVGIYKSQKTTPLALAYDPDNDPPF